MQITRRIVLSAIFCAISMGVYALESMIPPILPVPGVKLGLANCITLICIYIIGKRCAFFVLFVRLMLTCLLFSHPISFMFSFFGGMMSFIVMAIFKNFMSEENIWAVSVFGAFAHNFGQIVIAIIITGQINVAYYFLILIISSVITGAFTGICAQNAIKRLRKIIK